MTFPQRKHLKRLEWIFIPNFPLFYITINVEDRLDVLDNSGTAKILTNAWKYSLPTHGWMVGRYVIMPDHVHFFASPAHDFTKTLSRFINYWKRSTATKIRKIVFTEFRWQAEFFDHLLRSNESYAEKWEYVRQNPVRKKLVIDPLEWPYQGEIHALYEEV